MRYRKFDSCQTNKTPQKIKSYSPILVPFSKIEEETFWTEISQFNLNFCLVTINSSNYGIWMALRNQPKQRKASQNVKLTLTEFLDSHLQIIYLKGYMRMSDVPQVTLIYQIEVGGF